MSRELPNWLDEYETKKYDLEDVMNATTICTRRAWIREKIRVLEELYEKVNCSLPKLCIFAVMSIEATLVSMVFLDKIHMGFERRTIRYTE